ncbi:MAG: hypothetical protein AAB278_02420 [Pseudomonadota bacterium]
MSGWGCPHEVNDQCQKVLNKPCDIGMKGCVLAGRFNFADPSKNRPKKDQNVRQSESSTADEDEKE